MHCFHLTVWLALDFIQEHSSFLPRKSLKRDPFLNRGRKNNQALVFFDFLAQQPKEYAAKCPLTLLVECEHSVFFMDFTSAARIFEYGLRAECCYGPLDYAEGARLAFAQLIGDNCDGVVLGVHPRGETYSVVEKLQRG